MSDELISALYPPPPVFYKYFTKENLEKFKTWEESVDEDGAPAETALTEDGLQDEKSAEKAIEEKPVETGPESNEVENNSDEKKDTEPEKDHDRRVAPGELKFLQPPTPPPGTSYRGYGNIWSFEDKLPSLKSSNWEQLYEDDDEIITSETKIKELHKLMDSLLLNFLELISIVSINPSLFENKVKDISLILININHLLNTYRPHQLRESLIMLLKKQIEMKQLEIAQIDTVTKDITQKIINLTESIADEAIELELNTTDELQAKLDAIQRLTSD